MFSANIKIQTHVQEIRDNLISNPKTRIKLMGYGLIAAVYCLLNVYLGLRGWQAFSSQLSMPLYIVLLAALALIMPVAAYLLDQGREIKVFSKIIAYTGFYWTAFFMYAVILMAGMDLFQTINRFTHGRVFALLPGGLTVSRRAGIWLVIAGSLLILGIGTWLARRPRITGYLLKVGKRLPGSRPLRIALLSDIHFGSMVSTSNLELLCKRVRAQRPDLILLAGDLIDNSLDLIRKTDFVDHMSGQSRAGQCRHAGNRQFLSVGRHPGSAR
jgi:hypothetical protein